TIADHAKGAGAIIERDQSLFADERGPTEIFKDQIYTCFFEDFVGVKAMKELGAVDNMLIEMDYPHSDSTWPSSIKRAHEQVTNLSEEEKWKVLAGNAMRIHRFVPEYPDYPAGI
ncbi:MAG TPA: hypothetical protein VKG83_17335, partial [Mycobacterium sp.]|nr:hypothetical protein [Mycobacterium sp.]